MDLEYLRPRGYRPKGGFLSSSGIFYLNIPKNASTYLSNILFANGWKHHILNQGSAPLSQAIVILRDPVERWISGFATYASSWLLGHSYGSDHFVRDYNQLVERIIFDNLIFDDHTTPQWNYVSQLPATCQVKYFLLNQKTIVDDISAYVGQTLTVSDVDGNVSEDNYDQKQIIQFIKSRLEKKPELKNKIIERYQRDFDLIDSVK
jgi:hypothetical protein